MWDGDQSRERKRFLLFTWHLSELCEMFFFLTMMMYYFYNNNLKYDLTEGCIAGMKSVLDGISKVDGAWGGILEMVSYQECWKGWNPGYAWRGQLQEEGRIEGWGGVWEECFAWKNGKSSGYSSGVLSTLHSMKWGWCFMEKSPAVGDDITQGGSKWWVTAPGSSSKADQMVEF